MSKGDILGLALVAVFLLVMIVAQGWRINKDAQTIRDIAKSNYRLTIINAVQYNALEDMSSKYLYPRHKEFMVIIDAIGDSVDVEMKK